MRRLNNCQGDITMRMRISLFFAAFVFPFAVQAQATFGHWTTGEIQNNAGLYAATMNDSGALLGEYCFNATKVCQWKVGVDSVCEKGAEYPVLANTDKGAASFILVCDGQQTNGLYAFTFKNWKDLEGMIKAGERLGIATPMQIDQFKVFRFQLDGLNAAIKSMESTFVANLQLQKPAIKPAHSTTTDVL
jgi:hypothetical protein